MIPPSMLSCAFFIAITLMGTGTGIGSLQTWRYMLVVLKKHSFIEDPTLLQ